MWYMVYLQDKVSKPVTQGRLEFHPLDGTSVSFI